ncbi:flagellar hook-associated protein FlgK [Thioalkalivibrio denitrificans]|uniref:Flagellar hook-associated protein 1 n=1 Tax=Thioalkalivibrio denitrificans TaxID=108003 RepID=A0A1V3NPU9_9GAMM|nr:flagellar hook-associated protein FlgK [Thioalkalivibrio denitrificans]OOG27125.1 flagellar hook-associated protein FlgK [Thioalkalivibrio denitrificans]
MSSGVFGIGTSGLLAFQRALGVTSNNIANSATEGYTRQRINLSTQLPEFAGNGWFGNGVKVSGVQRIFDQFVENQLRTSTSGSQQHAIFYDYARRVDNLLADPDSGMAPGFQQFFAAVQDVANDPTASAPRQVLISEAQSLVDRFGFLDQRLNEQRSLLNGQIASSVSEINSIAQAIGDLNTEIVAAMGRSGGAPPNDLLDQRDRLVLELSELVSVNTIEQDDGALNVFIGNGQNLVLGNRVTNLVAEALGPDPDQMQVGYTSPGGAVDITQFMTGGRLGGLFEARGMLDQTQNSLGLTAIGLAQAFNDQHRLGQDLDGNLGEDFFRVPEPQIISGQDNVVTGVPTVNVENYGLLTTDDYLIRFNANDNAWELRREPGGQILDTAEVGVQDTLSLVTADDTVFTVDLSGLADENGGDSFLIRPTRTGASQIDTVITDPRKVAAAAPQMQATAGLNNEGEASIQSIRVDDASVLDNGPVTVTFIQSLDHFEINGDSFPRDPSGTTTITHNGWELVIEGTPDDGDTFQVSPNTAVVGDNRNALALAGLQQARVMGGGTASVQDTYANLVAEVGTRTRQAEVAARSQGKLLEEAQAQRESISGVNLDEEAANLLRYQQAYQAAAQVIAVTNTLFDTLINAVRR